MRNSKGQFIKGSSGFNGKHTEETKRKIREKRKGQIMWNKGKKGYKTKPCSLERKLKIGNAQKGELNHNWKGGKPKCIDCNVQFFQWNSKGKRCRKCSGIARRGENNWNWKGGLSRIPYPIYWRETLKRSIRERDNYICQLCSQYGNVIHHINYIKENCNPDNLITLCLSCNSKVNFGREKFTKYFQEKICLKK